MNFRLLQLDASLTLNCIFALISYLLLLFEVWQKRIQKSSQQLRHNLINTNIIHNVKMLYCTEHVI